MWIICYRDLDESTEKGREYLAAVQEEAIEEIILKPLENYVDKFNAAVERLLKVVPTEDSLKSTYHWSKTQAKSVISSMSSGR